ncbi:hypothetical protein wVul_0375 [Wolbachia endosymbiont of Armadillidium vulgare str. wVulC]|uniref:hypothetical protein n=1 Tax=Wolbachia endosymbiont of Armadillidium vulgare TaxID=77039 RepID=UPI00064B210E|nr:hypothetical protein [Wolbachia endosymbiont of Armadillidium vulgare]KLT23172.1 hypothetical protein wVul_0375 [Wolbachia endosymbiont of Armadillidium vulgare str. wVulC]OJH30762.1 Adventurous-gliding motility protein Z [Wolbachia endosymbiont of Armadillidium vulgare]OJH31903.1 Adventurous-gliding motility protein Z [Wolbachia endosymbiont of Armadillidium vulgare]
MPKENLFIAENQGLDVDEQKKNDILSFIESCNNFQDFIKKLEEENLIWYFIGPLRKDENIKEQIDLKWKKEFQKFEQSINEIHKKFEASLPGENFLVYTTKDNDFQIRFENKEKPIEISTLLRASDEGKVYNLSLGKDSQITATKKGSERHYDFTGSSSCEMTINWQAKDSKGNSIDCSMTVEVNSKGIKRVISEPRFGGITSSEEVLKLVKQNKEVFINGKILYQAFTDMGKSVNEQQTPAEETFTKNSPQSPILSSSGYSSPGSRRSSFSGVSEFSDEEDEMLENSMSDDEKEYEQEGSENGVDEIIDGIEELKEEKETFAQYFAKQAKQLEDLKSERNSLKKEVNEQQQAIFERDQKIKEQDASIKSLTEKLKKSEELNQNIEKEGDTEIRTLSEEKQILEGEVKRLKAELKRITQEKDQGIEQLTQEIKALEKELQGKNNAIGKLSDQLKDKENEINRINEEQQKKLEQSEAKLSALEKKNANLENDLKKTLAEGLKDNHEKQLVEELTEEKEKNNTLAKEMKLLSQEFNALQRKNEDLERKIRQLEPGRSLADEMSEVNTNEEIDKLKQQLKAKEGMLTHTQEELKSVKDALEQLQDILQQEKYQAAISTQTEVEYESRRTSMQQQDQDIQAVNNNSSRIASGLRQENKKLTRDKLTISEQLKQKIKEIDELKKNLKQLQEENTQLRQKATKGTVVNASSLADQREAKEEEARTNIPQNIMDWPVPIPDDKPEEQKTPLEPIKVNTELSDPNIVPAEASEKSTPSK